MATAESDDPAQTISALRDELADARDDSTRAGLFDALGIQLARGQRYEEALAQCTRAVELRELLALSDPHAAPYLGVSLGNQGGHFTALQRYDDALAAHTRAFEILSQQGALDSTALARIGYNAERMGALLSQLRSPSLAARLDGVALAVYLDLAEEDRSYLSRVRTQLHNLSLSLDALFSSEPEDRSGTRVGTDRLRALGTGSTRTANFLSRRALAEFKAGDLKRAVAAATHTVRYCELFLEPRGDLRLMSICANDLLRVASWSIALGGGEAAVAAAARAVELYEGEDLAQFGLHDAELAASRCVLGLLRAREMPDLAIAALSSAAESYASLVVRDRARFLPRFADCLHHHFALLASRGRAAEATTILAHAEALYEEIALDPRRFDLDVQTTLERIRFLCVEIPNLGPADLRASNCIAARLDGFLQVTVPAAARTVVSGQRPQNKSEDRRLWSCTGNQLSLLVGDLIDRGFASSDVHTLGKRLREAKLYVARDFEYRCVPRPPQVFITYTWSDNFVDLQVAIRSALNYLGGLVRRARPDLDDQVVERLVNEKLGLWLDFIFIDQAARDLVLEVREVLPQAIAAADVHFVLSDTAMLRSWCCYELALFNQRAATEAMGQRTLRSFVARSMNLNYQSFLRTSTSNPEDKVVIQQAIHDLYPGGMPALELLLIQTSMLSDPFVAEGFAQFGPSEQLVTLSIDKWLNL